MVPDVPAAPPLAECRSAHRGRAKRVVQLEIGEQAAVRSDLGTVELQVDPAVERDPNRLVGLTRRVRHSGPTPLPLSPLKYIPKSTLDAARMRLHMGSRRQRVSPECAWHVEPVCGAALPTQADRRCQAKRASPVRECAVEGRELRRSVAGGEVEGVGEVEARLEAVEGACGDRRMVERQLVEVDQAPQAFDDRRPRPPGSVTGAPIRSPGGRTW